ncbi:hypothetical protein TREES_T100006244 [Tupaia chinensis]|uniref:Uncharacterized protein n=1 Tax=Tupaia chinensis TaxID=246437 RepID=L9LCQ9_TUPCH|nr:hypothetical protein TREES_T100006244 [Tupaia chinensis]
MAAPRAGQSVNQRYQTGEQDTWASTVRISPVRRHLGILTQHADVHEPKIRSSPAALLSSSHGDGEEPPPVSEASAQLQGCWEGENRVSAAPCPGVLTASGRHANSPTPQGPAPPLARVEQVPAWAAPGGGSSVVEHLGFRSPQGRACALAAQGPSLQNSRVGSCKRRQGTEGRVSVRAPAHAVSPAEHGKRSQVRACNARRPEPEPTRADPGLQHVPTARSPPQPRHRPRSVAALVTGL